MVEVAKALNTAYDDYITADVTMTCWCLDSMYNMFLPKNCSDDLMTINYD